MPENTLRLAPRAVAHDADTVYAAFDNHKMGDFKPYLLKSTDRGRTWTSIAGNLPAARHASTWSSRTTRSPTCSSPAPSSASSSRSTAAGSGCSSKGGLPTIAVRDLAIQQRENDLVLATFGRGFYVLDDYSPLRQADAGRARRGDRAVPGAAARGCSCPSLPLGWRGKGFLGESFYAAPNPPFGAVFTYYLKDELKSARKARREQEKKTAKEGGDVRYPTWDALRAEDREEAPAVVLTVTDEAGNVVRRLTGPATAGFHRVAWDLRYAAAEPGQPRDVPEPTTCSRRRPIGPLAAPGTYTVTLAARVARASSRRSASRRRSRRCRSGRRRCRNQDRAGLLEFQQKTARLQRAVLGASQLAGDLRQAADADREGRRGHAEGRPEADGRGARAREPGARHPGRAERRHRRAPPQRADAALDRGAGAGRRLRALDVDVRGDRDAPAVPRDRGGAVRARARAAPDARRGGHEGAERAARGDRRPVDAGGRVPRWGEEQ